ncbi:hypothetical protein LPJ61_003479 [Coemansia biformis]|uniref:SCP domain-containing protein n=1 Tax=Coemansia biformis TaxID=1286918 RepID=A0A9W7YCY3_9FUNG|nr:hypothetical protein LPJ61_003479 [Coemansia biformis]
MVRIPAVFLAAAMLLMMAVSLVTAAPIDVVPEQARRDYHEVASPYRPHPLGAVTQVVTKLVYGQRPTYAATPAQPSSAYYSSASAPPTSDWQSQMLQQLNAIRAEVGKAPVSLHANLNAMAQSHSQYQASVNTMTHSDPAGTLGSRCTQYGIDWSGVAENVAYNYKDVTSVMQGWKTSPGHYANMVGDYNSVGFGVSDLYWTQDFASV